MAVSSKLANGTNLWTLPLRWYGMNFVELSTRLPVFLLGPSFVLLAPKRTVGCRACDLMELPTLWYTSNVHQVPPWQRDKRLPWWGTPQPPTAASPAVLTTVFSESESTHIHLGNRICTSFFLLFFFLFYCPTSLLLLGASLRYISELSFIFLCFSPFFVFFFL